MASLVAVREAVADRLRTITDLNVQPTVPGNVVAPAAVVAPAQGTFVNYDVTLDQSVDINLTVTLLVSTVISDAAQNKLDGYLASSGPDSVKAAVDGDVTLGGVAHYAAVTEARNYGLLNYGGSDYLGCEFAVVVRAQ